MNASDKNKFLIIKDGVVLNPLLDRVVAKLDFFFEAANHVAYVTSGVRVAEDQLRIIKQYVKKKNIQDEFIETANLTKMEDWNGRRIFGWQLAWSKLLNAGVIINPPLAAEVLLDYVNRSGQNRKGFIINPSVHFKGTALDIGGGSNSIADEVIIIQEAIDSKKIPEIIGTVPERENNCLHVDVKEV